MSTYYVQVPAGKRIVGDVGAIRIPADPHISPLLLLAEDGTVRAAFAPDRWDFVAKLHDGSDDAVALREAKAKFDQRVADANVKREDLINEVREVLKRCMDSGLTGVV